MIETMQQAIKQTTEPVSFKKTSAQLAIAGQIKEYGAQKTECTQEYMSIFSTARRRAGPLEVVVQRSFKDEQRTRCEVWTRVMGYHRPVSAFNLGKQSEFHDRKFFKESVIQSES